MVPAMTAQLNAWLAANGNAGEATDACSDPVVAPVALSASSLIDAGPNGNWPHRGDADHQRRSDEWQHADAGDQRDLPAGRWCELPRGEDRGQRQLVPSQSAAAHHWA